MTSMDERVLRGQAINHVRAVWNLSEASVVAKRNFISERLSNDRARVRLEESFRVFEDAISQLTFDEAYAKAEDPQTFKNIIETLMDAFKHLFYSNIVEEDDDFRSDAIDDLSRNYYRKMEIRLDLPQYGLHITHAPITTLIRTVRNCQQHEMERPKDLLTELDSFGNLHTLASICILSTYAYYEILGVWCKVVLRDEGGSP